jgi:hypothetical protein
VRKRNENAFACSFAVYCGGDVCFASPHPVVTKATNVRKDADAEEF